MGKTYEESFASILNNHGFEIKKSDVEGAYFIFDTWNKDFYPYPNWKELAASEEPVLRLQEVCKNIVIEPDKNGNYHLAESTFDKLFNAITAKDSTELVAKVEQTYNIFHNNSELREQYVIDICRDCEGSPYLRSCPLNSIGDVLALEEQLLANKDKDPEAKQMLDIIGDRFDDIRFLLNCDIDALNLDKVYAAQEASKGEYRDYVKADKPKPTKTKQDVER